MSSPILLKVEKVSKIYKTDFWKRPVCAVDDASFEVHEKGVVGIVGPNGAGKTTALKMILGITRPTRGRITLMGEAPYQRQAKKNIGYLPESAYYYDFLNARELLRFYGGVFSVPRDVLYPRVEELLKLVGLSEKAHIKLRGFSKGMLQRVGIAQALINDPQLVILDEPMSGLDPIGRKDVRDIILRLKEQGKTILFSSHILHDVETLCDRVVIIFRGRVVAQGSMDELLLDQRHGYEVQVKTDTFEAPDALKSVVAVRTGGGVCDIQLQDASRLFELINDIYARGMEVVSVTPMRDSLEALFLRFQSDAESLKGRG